MRHRLFDVLGLRLEFRAFPEETGNAFCIVDCLVPPGKGAPANFHAGETECFIVTAGRFDFRIGDETRQVGQGEVVVVPDGAIHGFRCTSETPGRVVVVNSPGHVHAAFFSDLGDPLPEGFQGLPEPKAPDLARIMAAGQAAGITFLPPG